MFFLRPRLLKFTLSLFSILVVAPLAISKDFKTEKYPVRVEAVLSGLQNPWGFCFNEDKILITLKTGKLVIFDRKTGKSRRFEVDLPVTSRGQGGLLDVLCGKAAFGDDRVFLTFSHDMGSKNTTSLATAKITPEGLTGIKILFSASPAENSGLHFGSRIRFGGDGMLYMSVGERGNKPKAQTKKDHGGKIIRLRPDGSVPDDNPFRKDTAYFAEIYSLGHRNPQGMAVDPVTGEIWTSEHGAMGGDEINRIMPGKNYGWPLVTYGKDYDGSKIGSGTSAPGIEQPVHYWDPSIAPAGMDFYTGKLFPGWKNNLFVTALKYQLIARLELSNGKVVKEERLFAGEFGRRRDVKTTPEGTLMFITDSPAGALYEVSPGKK